MDAASPLREALEMAWSPVAPTSRISEAKSDGRERWRKSPGGPEGPFPVEPELIGVGMGVSCPTRQPRGTWEM